MQFMFFAAILSFLRFVNVIYAFLWSGIDKKVVFVHFFVYFDIVFFLKLQTVNIIYLF